MTASEIAFFRNAFIRAAGRGFSLEEAEDVNAALFFDESMALPADLFMQRLIGLIRNAEQASTDRMPAAVALVTNLAEARHLVGVA